MGSREPVSPTRPNTVSRLLDIVHCAKREKEDLVYPDPKNKDKEKHGTFDLEPEDMIELCKLEFFSNETSGSISIRLVAAD